MTTLLMIEPHGVGGVHTYTVQLSRALCERGVEVHLLTSEATAVDDETYAARVERRLPSFSAGGDLPSLARRGHSLGRHVRGARTQLAEAGAPGIDVVHVQWPPARLTGRVLRGLSRRRPLVVTVHNVVPHEKTTRPRQSAWRAVYHAADVLVCHTAQSADDLCATYGAGLAERVAVIHHGCGAPGLRPGALPSSAEARARLGLPIDAELVLFVGAVRPYKGLSMVLEALPQIAARRPRSKLVVVGVCHDWTPYEARLRRDDTAGSVIRHGEWIPDEEVALYVLGCDLVALPYAHIDASGVAALAASLGRPMVLSDIAGFRSAWSDAEAVFVERRPDAWSEAIIGLLEDPDGAASIAAGAAKRAASELSWQRSAELHEHAYARALSGRRPRSS